MLTLTVTDATTVADLRLWVALLNRINVDDDVTVGYSEVDSTLTVTVPDLWCVTCVDPEAD